MSYYWMYYAATLFASLAQRNPYIALGVIAFFLVRQWLPDPVIISRNLTRIGALKRQASLNPANVVARRDIAQAYLDLRWYRSALRYLDEAHARAPNDRELAYLRGLALLGRNEPELALRAFGTAVGIDPDRGEPFSSASARTNERDFRRHAEAYLGAARALERLGRFEQAAEALDVCIACNSSSLEPLVMLARVRARSGDHDGAYAAKKQARKTWSELPGFMRRKELRWWLRTFW
jgi:tetratricopeptide (TPR) repeat protein